MRKIQKRSAGRTEQAVRSAHHGEPPMPFESN
jgi:hypothetical protein